MLGRWAVAGALAVAAFAAGFAVASSTGDDEPRRPTASTIETKPTSTPAIHNLELVVGIKPLRSTAGALPPPSAAVNVPAAPHGTDVETVP